MTEDGNKYNLTHPQQRIWYTERMHPGTGMWNNAGTLKVKGLIDLSLLERALNIFLEENESMRLRIGVDKGAPCQYVAPFEPYHVETLDFSELGLEKLYEWDSRQTRAPMPLIDSRLYYFVFLSVSPEECWVYAKFHHIISDALSILEFSNQVVESYRMLIGGVEPPRVERPSYINYIAGEKAYLASKRYAYDREYWQKRFADLQEPTILKPKKNNDLRTEAQRRVFVLADAFSERIYRYCEAADISVFALFLSALAIYINRVTGKKDVIIGAPVANRSALSEKAMFGMFVSMVPVRIEISDELSFTEFSQIVSNEWFSALKHQKYPFDVLMHELHQTYKNLDSLYDVTLSYQFGKLQKKSTRFTFESRWHFSGNQASALNIHVNDREDEGRFILDYDHQTPLFYSKEIEYFHTHLVNIIRDMIRHPDKPLYLLDLMEEEERKRILHRFNDTARTFPQEETLTELLQRSFREASGKAAVICAGESMSYGELDMRSDALAAHLVDLGVRKDSIVGLVAERNMDLFVSIAGILKAGGAFLPIDPELPADRIAYMLEDSGADILLVSPRYACKCPKENGLRVIRTDARPKAAQGMQSSCTPDSLAYVIYTSGSTGTPKGVMIEHHSIVNFAYFMREKYDLSPGGRMLCAGSISFDLSILEFVPALTNGLTLVLAQEHEASVPRNLAQLIQAHSVNMMFVTPGRMELLLSDRLGRECIADFREIGLGGDVLSEELLMRVQKSTRARITNLYGPTEITICCTMADVTSARIPSIGHPLPGVKAYILDIHRNPVPIGVPGELYIGGPGVARGYIRKPDLTEERFIESPFVSGVRLYRTGDLARWYPQGEIEFLGRIDKQVKIRGFRIELGEIENRLLKVPGVSSCVVKDYTDPSGRRFLCAYLCGNLPNISDIKAQLNRDLPSYMIPSVFIAMDSLPFNVSGKVDRSQLPNPMAYLEGQKEDYQPPETTTEKLLAEIWSAELGLARIGRNDSFFDLGGDSLSILHVMAQVEQQFHVAFRHEDVYRSPRLSDMAVIIDAAEQSAYRPILRAPEQRSYPVSSAQQRMWVVARSDGNSISYNVPVAFEIKGSVDAGRLRSAFQKLIAHHEILRTSFILSGATLKQKVRKRVKFRMETISCEKRGLKRLLKSLIQPFDLAEAPLMRAALIDISPRHHVLFIDMHHIISDQRSMKIMMRNLAALYRDEELLPTALEYRDYAVWQQEFMRSESINLQREYWKNVLSGELPLLNLHTDRPRPALQRFEGARYAFRIKNAEAEALRTFAKRNGGTLFMAVLAVYNVLLMRYTGQEDIIVGTPTSGRMREELSDMAGVFLNTLPIRCFPQGDLSFTEFYGNVIRTCAAAFSNADCPLERMVADIRLPRDPSRNPLFDTMLVVAKNDAGMFLGDARTSIYPFDPGFAKLDLTLEVYENDGELMCSFEYSKRLFKRERIRRMAAHLSRLISLLPESPEVRLADAEMMTHQEIWQVTQGFNQTDLPIESDHRIQTVFERIADRFPDKTALIADDGQVTFSELNRRANHIARRLRDCGVGRNTIVGLCIGRSLGLMTGLLGVLKAGGGYLPVDPTYPSDRIAFMLKDSEAKVLLTDKVMDYGFSGEKIMVSEIANDRPQDNVKPIDRMEDVGYVIYTSGSTGMPKGASLPRRGMINLYETAKTAIAYEPGETSVSVTTVSFDIFIGDALLPLLFGCTVILCNEEQLRQPHLLAELMNETKPTFIQTTPTRMRIMMENHAFREAASRYIRKIVLGGEIIPASLLKLIKKHIPARIINGYGPSEATVYASFKDLTHTSAVTIGRPAANTRFYMLDRYIRPTPIGVLGEAYISGSGVAIGYINRPELNREKFVPDPFWPGHMMYQTGDVCAFLPDGDIEMVGRMDHQVKIRGLRIELGEIEAAMRSVKGVGETVVKDWGEGVGKYLCAYYTTADPDVDEEIIRAYLSKRLPIYMVPTHFVRMAAMPLTLSGKVNRKALLEPNTSHKQQNSRIDAGNMTANEKKMVGIWSRVLKKGGITPHSKFLDLGGDSLGIIKVQTAAMLFGWTLHSRDFFEGKSLREICAHLKASVETQLPKKPSASRGAHIPGFSHLKPLKMKSILLTGATGYLGMHLLAELAEMPGTHIWCIVRGRDLSACRKYFCEVLNFYFGLQKCRQYSSRVTVLKGDISEKRLGLSDEDYRAVGETVDTVIHSAAITDHMGRAELFNRVNVTGTHNAVAVAKSIGASLLHVSTCSVSGTYYVNDPLRKGDFTEQDYDIGQNYADNEYVRTKFIAEGIVLDALKQGLNARILRVGTLTGTMEGKFQINPQRNAFANRVAALCNIGIVPIGALGIRIEMTPVDVCAQAILKLSMLDEKRAVHHIYNTHTVTLAETVSMLEQCGFKIEVLSDREFTEKVNGLISKGNLVQVSGLVPDLKAVQSEPAIRIAADATQRSLVKVGFAWPQIDASYVRKFVACLSGIYSKGNER